MLNEKKGEPAEKRDFQTSNRVRRVQSTNQPGQGIIDNNCGNDCQDISANAMSTLDIGHCAGVKVEPLLAKDCVPAPTNKLMHDNQGPNSEVIDLVGHLRQ